MATSKAPAPRDASDDLRAEYDLDYAESRPNRFAHRMGDTVVAVVLEPDVAAVFDTSEVNRLLRSVIAALPPEKRRSATTKTRQESTA